MGDALEKMSGIQFRQDKKDDAIYAYIYNQGRKDMCLELLNFDANTLSAARDKATANSTTQEG